MATFTSSHYSDPLQHFFGTCCSYYDISYVLIIESVIKHDTLFCAPVNLLKSHVVDVSTGTIELSWPNNADY